MVGWGLVGGGSTGVLVVVGGVGGVSGVGGTGVLLVNPVVARIVS